MEPVLADEAVVAAFARDGVACVRQVLDREEVGVAAAAIDAVLAELPAGAVMDHPLFPVVWPA